MVMAYFGVDSDATKVKVIDEAQSENHADFWKCLAGRRTYADHRIHKCGAALPRAFTEAVFFDVRDGGGVARVAGDQRSLGRSTALVVDARCYVFLWLGANVRKKAARRAPVWKSTTGLGGPHQTSELSISVKSKSIRLIFGRIDCSRRVCEAQLKNLRRKGRIRAH